MLAATIWPAKIQKRGGRIRVLDLFTKILTTDGRGAW